MTTNTYIKVTLTPELRLEQVLKEANHSLVTKLTIVGTTTYADFKYISENMGETLQVLDLSGVSGKDAEISFFHDMPRLTTLTLPDTYENDLIRIYSNFSCLTTLAIHPDNPVMASEDGVLYNKEKTSLVFFPSGKQGEYFIPASVNYLDRQDIFFCPHLTAITVHPDNPKYASLNGMLFNKEITKLIRYPGARQGECFFPASVVAIDYRAFRYCAAPITAFFVHSDNPAYTSDDGVLFNKDKTELIYYPRGRQGDYVIPETVIETGSDAFYDCTGLKSIINNSSMKEISLGMFCGCPITSIYIPKSVKDICTTFDYHDAIDTITVHPDNPVYASHDGVLFNKDKTELIRCPEGRKGDYVIPETVTEIDERAFNSCYNLTSITIPKSLTEIDDNIFYSCKGLSSIVVLPDNPALPISTTVSGITIEVNSAQWQNVLSPIAVTPSGIT